MHRRAKKITALAAVSLLGLVLVSRITVPGYTRIALTAENGKGTLLSAVLQNDEQITLTWRNSQFGLNVTEVFHAQNGVLVQDRVTFALPGGPPPPLVAPQDVDDLYHTGGPFDARGLHRPFTRIIYRIGEIGEPKLHVQNKTVAFKNLVGFGGKLVLTTDRPALYEIVISR
jgi:hypothetical protein